MTIHLIISLAGIGLSVVLALAVLVRDGRTFAGRAFACGMAALALERGFSVLSMEAVTPAAFLRWEYFRILAAGLLPCPWLFFSLSFARDNYRDFLAQWKWHALVVSVLPFLLALFAREALYARFVTLEADAEWVLQLGWAGYAFQVLFLLNTVLILINLERTLRASYGSARWRIKFTLLGVAFVFAVRIYTISETLLFSAASARFTTLNSMVLLMADLLIVVSMLRDRLQATNIYVSQQVLQNSFTLLIVGGYLLLLGLVAKASQYFEIGRLLLDNALLIFLGLLGAAVLLLSDDLRHRARGFIHRHFERPTHDYRHIWTTFTARTASLVDLRDICQALARTVAETFGVSAVNVWLADEGQARPSLAASTALSESDPQLVEALEKEVAVLMHTMRKENAPMDLRRREGDTLPSAPGTPLSPPSPGTNHPGYSPPSTPSGGTRSTSSANETTGAPLPLSAESIRYCAALAVGGEFLGVMTLNDRTSHESFSFEDLDLLKTLCEQGAGILLNHRLFESLSRAKEMAAFQAFSAFFVHDLKNVASTLSLTLENLPVHYEDPEFRRDAMRLIANSVEKIRSMTSRMSLFRQKLELQRVECDLNELVTATLATLDGVPGQSLTTELGTIPMLWADPEQLQKVLVNLILNAREASPEGSDILIATGLAGSCVALSVSDHGCGMSEDFIRKDLFHPFKTTKDRGLGIGLFHCKAIVEAHRGRIEVESKPGQGSTFRVLLPVGTA